MAIHILSHHPLTYPRYAYWNNSVDGLFSWDSCWPNRSDTDAGSIERDQVVIDGAAKNHKTYMVGMFFFPPLVFYRIQLTCYNRAQSAAVQELRK
jgi:hypothetical protein